MMASKPVLVNSEVDKSEWILKNDIGYVCPYGDINALVNIIKHIQQNPDEAKRKGENGRRIYEEGYNWPVMEKKIWNMLKEFVVF
jgi:glycosyltransferase involved in cell wall biosynthesis